MAEVIFESVDVKRIGHLQLIPFLTEVSGRETSLSDYKIAIANPFDITVSILK